MRKRLLLLLNGTAGKGKLGSSVYDIVKYFTLNGFDVVFRPVEPAAGLGSEEVMARVGGEFDYIVCGGGDGTLNHVINGLMKFREEDRPILGYIPAGSTNDFAKNVGIPVTVTGACRTVATGVPFKYDIGKLNDRYYNYVGAFGAFTKVTYSTNQTFKNAVGHAAYLLQAISTLQENINYSARIKFSADSFETEGDYVFGAIYSSSSVGGFAVPGNKTISLDDGTFEMLLINKPANFYELSATANALVNGKFDNQYISFHRVKKVSITSEDDVSWTLDGEYGGSFRNMEFEVQKHAITIMTPAKRSKKK